MTAKVTRPPLRYHGGKFRMAKNIIPLMPNHLTYVEPFGGGAGVLLQKSRSKNEIYNDLDGDIVNVFKVLRDPDHSAQLIKLLELTPFARDEFELAYEETVNVIEQARRTIVRSAMGFSSAGATKGRTGFRGLDRTDSRSSTASQWVGWPRHLSAVTNRLQGTIIENSKAVDLIDRLDQSDTLFYVDPPYMADTRSSMKSGSKYYRHEMTDDQHEQLLEKLLQVKGKVILSGYDHDMYNDLLTGWDKQTFDARAASNSGTVMRKECVWISPNAAQPNLFNIS